MNPQFLHDGDTQIMNYRSNDHIVTMNQDNTRRSSHDCDAQLIQEGVVLAVSKVYDRVNLMGQMVMVRLRFHLFFKQKSEKVRFKIVKNAEKYWQDLKRSSVNFGRNIQKSTKDKEEYSS